MPSFDVTWLGYLMGAVAIYYLCLFVLSTRVLGRRPRPLTAPPPFVVLVVPAHNEELVIEETLASLTRLDYEEYGVLVMNDGSADSTSERARSFTRDAPVYVVDRPPEEAGQGKGAVLNHAVEVVREARDNGDERLAGRSTSEIVIGVVNADGDV